VFRLTLRLVRGGGVAGVIRLALMLIGVAVGVAATMLVAALPVVLDARKATAEARTPRAAATELAVRFHFAESVQVWDGRRLGRVLVADVGPSTPLPPGVDRLPGPGEAVVSPALAARLGSDTNLRDLIPGRLIGTIGPPGLLGPDELFAYVGVTEADAGGLTGASGWGSRDDLLLQRQHEGLPQGLALLILPPVVVYLVVCSRLAAATRARRYASLRLLGLRRGATLRLAAGEAAVAGGLGAILGLVAFDLVHPLLADSGVLGFRWYPTVAEPTPAVSVVIVAAVALASAFFGMVGLRRSLSRPVHNRVDVAEPRSRAWLLAPLTLGLGMLTYPLLVVPPRPTGADVRFAMGDGLAWVVIVGTALACGGLLLGLRPLIVGLGALLDREWVPRALRLGARRMRSEPASTLRLLSGVALLLMVAGVGAGLMRDLALRAGPTVTNYDVSLAIAPDQDPTVLQRSFQTAAEYRWTTQGSVVVPPPAGAVADTPAERIEFFGLDLLTVDCRSLRAIVGADLPECVDGRLYRMGTPAILGSEFDVPPGTQVRFATANGGERYITVPAETVTIPERAFFTTPDRPILLFTGVEPMLGWTAQTRIGYLVSGRDGELARFKAAIARIDPSLHLQVSGENLELLEIYYHQRGVLTTGVFVGFLLGTLAFAIASVDRVIEQRRNIAVLRVLGMRTRTIRAVEVAQLGLPLAAVLLIGGLLGHLGGNAALRLNDVHRPWFYGTLAAMAPLVAVAVLVVLFAGAVVAGQRLRAEDLRRE
jgi:hypothetical protein